jgi:two-component sensor histidine kinase
MNEIKSLNSRIQELEEENKALRSRIENTFPKGNTVGVPGDFKEIFDQAEATVGKYFEGFSATPSKGMIEINDERYVLLRASSLSVGFLNIIKDLYSDKGEEEAFTIGRNFLFDISHVIGLEDAGKFHKSMGLNDPISKLSAGPVHFAYTGWAKVEVMPESNPSPDDNYYLKYNHPYSFEADSWIKAGIKSDHPVCIMNAGYSSGWCEESFGISLTSVEITCRAKGDEKCTFIMAPPHRIDGYVKSERGYDNEKPYEVPLFFERKKIEEKIKQSLKEKNILLKEVHHRVKNNLQVISSLLNLQSNYVIDDNSKLLFKETQNRIKTLALVHEKLYKSDDVEYVNLKDYLVSIVELLSYSFNKEYIDIEYDFDEITKIDIEKAIPCGLITNEIISNSFKYAFPKKIVGRIDIKLRNKGNDYVLTISDNGVGMPEDIDIKSSKSLGLELINALVGQLEGQLEIGAKKGTEYCFTFPIG